MSSGLVLVIAMLLDAALGEPDWLWRRLPHPAVVTGRLIDWIERKLNHDTARQVKGLAVVIALVLLGWLLGTLLSFGGPLIEIAVVAILVAQRSLVQHVRAVADGLRMSIAQGRRAVAMIVSRDTTDMQEPAVARSAIESAAENLSDGVVAPAFWFLIGGLPGIIIYKLVNTADSMIGYRSAQFEDFGKAAAKLDDLLNWVPARLTALLIAAPAGVLRDWPAIKADAALHRSPNAGWPEASMARALGVALAGPRAYDGQMQDFAWVNAAGVRGIGAVEIGACLTQLWQAWVMTLVLAAVLGIWIG